ncbi:hypothetical protein I551_6511 [Mycobacterium ulcerans str. Harvey]|uniref:Uncharacterized protein n=1 Tax=Mycobacterium ulcerans str. Harvey TaxID=1299332 RepID=A0ABN0QQU9_MYCUL|nr:hypothetical protein I551_6511 [Mycobacterium ulcerans str. Harvey]
MRVPISPPAGWYADPGGSGDDDSGDDDIGTVSAGLSTVGQTLG